jgi:hypothetical protein
MRLTKRYSERNTLRGAMSLFSPILALAHVYENQTPGDPGASDKFEKAIERRLGQFRGVEALL